MGGRKLTKRVIDGAEKAEREYMVWDSEVAGFGLRVYPSGRKAYVLKYRVGGGRNGTVRKPVIGTHGTLTVDQARVIAKDWAAEVRRGNDPSAERDRSRKAPMIGDLFDRYLAEHAQAHKKPSSVANDERIIKKRLIPAFGRHKVAEVTRAHVAEFHRSLSATPYEANRALALLSKMFNLAELWDMRPDGTNPAGMSGSTVKTSASASCRRRSWRSSARP